MQMRVPRPGTCPGRHRQSSKWFSCLSPVQSYYAKIALPKTLVVFLDFVLTAAAISSHNGKTRTEERKANRLRNVLFSRARDRSNQSLRGLAIRLFCRGAILRRIFRYQSNFGGVAGNLKLRERPRSFPNRRIGEEVVIRGGIADQPVDQSLESCVARESCCTAVLEFPNSDLERRAEFRRQATVYVIKGSECGETHNLMRH